MIKTTSFKLDSELLKRIKIKAIEKDMTQSELVTTYLLNGLKEDESMSNVDLSDLEQKLNIKSDNHLDSIDFEVPEMLKYNPDNVSKSVNEESIKLDTDDVDSKDIFSNVMGIVSIPDRINSVDLKKEIL